ncbi:retinaldehyde-binding protein 1-like [Uloborus diversus]|uniref:retinaldehyde-binding protein 1-like n=1 Tax=Uloborus diversus TaxID=327109 RepID=UPI0024096233|nr:retinaldehyde-binding protein 1-like [Uloborus diversus]
MTRCSSAASFQFQARQQSNSDNAQPGSHSASCPAAAAPGMLPELPAQLQCSSRSEALRSDEHLPYSCTVVSGALMEYAAKHLNETEETRKKGLKELRELLKKDKELLFTDEDIFLLCFLRSRKFDVKRSAELLRRGLEFVDSNSKLIDRSDAFNVVRKTMEANVIGFLPYRDRQGKAILYCRAEPWDPKELPPEDAIFGSIVAIQTAMDNPVNQIAGFVVILDLDELKMTQVIAMVPWLVFGIQALQSCCPCLVKQFHVINTPSIFKVGWKLVKPIISTKIRKRISFHKSSNWTALHNIVPPTLLPTELGGQLGPFNNEHWAKDTDTMVRECYKKFQANGILSKKKQIAVPLEPEFNSCCNM